MKVLLAYNDYDSISGERSFFDNMRMGLGGSGLDVDFCAIPQMTPGTCAGALDMYLRFPLLLRTYLRLRSQSGYDVLHFLNASLAPAAALMGGRPVIATSHFLASSYHELSPPAGLAGRSLDSCYCRYASFLERSAFSRLDRVVACTGYHARQLIERYSLDATKVSVIPPGIDLERFRRAEPMDLKNEYGCEEIIMYLGRHHERSKGVSYLIRAMAHLDRDAKLIILGDGPDKTAYQRLAARLGLAGRIVFLGRVGPDIKPSLQKSADVAVMPSLFEVFGTVFAESLACEVPVVAFDLPFWRGIYDGAGLFVRRDPASLATGISQVLDDDGLQRRLIRRGRAYAEEYDIRRTISSYADLYHGLTG